MSDNVIGLHGKPVTAPGEVNPDTVELLEVLLEDARAGRITAVIAVSNYTDGVRFATVGDHIGFSMLGGLEMAKVGLTNLLGEEVQ